MKKRIKDTPVPFDESNSIFVKSCRKCINYYYGSPKEETVYISDLETENQLTEILYESASKIIYFTGKSGIGKTTLLKHCMEISDHTVRVDENKETMYVAFNFRSLLLKECFEEVLINWIKGICAKLEDYYEFAERFYSTEYYEEFYDHISKIEPVLLGMADTSRLIEKTNKEIRIERLLCGEKKAPYIYQVNRLKYYIKNYCPRVKKIIYIFDDMEVLPQAFICNVVRDLLAFYSKCIEQAECSVYALFSMRQETYEMIQTHSEIKAYSPSVYLKKEKPVNIKDYHIEKHKLVCLDNTTEDSNLWEQTYKVLTDFCAKYDYRYSQLIQNLCNYDFQLVKRMYKKVLMNTLWLSKRGIMDIENADSLFNNISVLRSLACGNNAVYRGSKSSIIPNVLISDEFNDNSIYALLIMCCFMRKGKMLKYDYISNVFRYLFPKESEIHDSVKRIIGCFIHMKVLEITYDSEEVLEQNKKLVITPRGREIWNMFSSDSVLLEMYREDYYFDADDNDCRFLSSYSLMEEGQCEIFIQIFHLIDLILEKEKLLHKMAASNNTLSEYYSCFGSRLVSKHLLEGVEKSIDYSGNTNASRIPEIKMTLLHKMDRIDAFE